MRGACSSSEDQGDYVAGHVTARLPDGDGRFLMKPAGIGLEEMTPENIITVDAEGERIGGTMPRHNEVFIHSEILRVRPDIVAVVHTHPAHAVAFSSLGRPLLPVGNDGSIFRAGVPVFSETTDLIIDPARGKAVARCLGEHQALILRNHGIVTAGRSIEEAVWLALKLERACRRAAPGRGRRRPQAVRRRRRFAEEEPARQSHGPPHQRVQLSGRGAGKCRHGGSAAGPVELRPQRRAHRRSAHR